MERKFQFVRLEILNLITLHPDRAVFKDERVALFVYWRRSKPTQRTGAVSIITRHYAMFARWGANSRSAAL